MIVTSSGTKLTVRTRPGEFAPREKQNVHMKDGVFNDLTEWGMDSASISSALGVKPDRVRSWRSRPYNIEWCYWDALLALHKAASAAIATAKTVQKINATEPA